MLLCAGALAVVLVSCAGAIGFVGLVLPHVTRALTGSGHVRLLLAAALTGAVFLVWVDTLGPDSGLRADRVARRIDGRLIVDGVTLGLRPGETVGLLGPNGSGKSTLLCLLAGVLPASTGVVTLDRRPLPEVGRRVTARRIASVEQHTHTRTQAELNVREVVALGRVPHRRAWLPASAAVAEALERTGLTDRASQTWHTLSSRERQRAQSARALAQGPRELLRDEPTNHLDIQHQLDLLDLIADLPVTTVIALHDLNLAAMYCDRLLVLDPRPSRDPLPAAGERDVVAEGRGRQGGEGAALYSGGRWFTTSAAASAGVPASPRRSACPGR